MKFHFKSSLLKVRHLQDQITTLVLTQVQLIISTSIKHAHRTQLEVFSVIILIKSKYCDNFDNTCLHYTTESLK